MYHFTIYNIDDIAPTSKPPGRTNLSASQKPYIGSWAGGLGWAQTATRELDPGRYVCIATSENFLEPQGVWAFTVGGLKVVFDVVPGTVEAGV